MSTQCDRHMTLTTHFAWAIFSYLKGITINTGFYIEYYNDLILGHKVTEFLSKGQDGQVVDICST